MDTSNSTLNRREFLQKGAAVAAGSAAVAAGGPGMARTALSSSRIVGANDRISLGHIGIGNRGNELHGIVAALKDAKNVEVSAVCDLWAHNLERAVAANPNYSGTAPSASTPP